MLPGPPFCCRTNVGGICEGSRLHEHPVISVVSIGSYKSRVASEVLPHPNSIVSAMTSSNVLAIDVSWHKTNQLIINEVRCLVGGYDIIGPSACDDVSDGVMVDVSSYATFVSSYGESHSGGECAAH